MTAPSPWKWDPSKASTVQEHELADICPRMSNDEYKALKDDIEANGLRVPIVIYQGKVLDGRHRLKAILEFRRQYDLKDDENFRVYEGSDPVGEVLSLNVKRRVLSVSQRSMIAAKLVTTKLGFNQYTKNKEGRPIDQPTAAKMLGVSEKSVQRAKEVLEKCIPEIVSKVQQGKLAVSLAEKVGELPREKQVELASKTKEEIIEATKPKEPPKELTTPEVSDNLDDVEDAYIAALKELKARSLTNAKTAVSALVQRLQDLDFDVDFAEEPEEEINEAA
jgi:hypothetical protein